MSKQRTLDFIYFDAGGGHRSAALALQAVIGELGYPWEVRLLNLQEALDSLDIFRKLTGIRLEDIYNLALARGWTLGSTYLLPCMHAVIRLYHGAQVRLLKDVWHARRPDMVVSLIPNFNRALAQSLRATCPAAPFVTVLTDLADYPPHFWMEKQRQFLICGTNKAVKQATAMGFANDEVFRTSGMILRPEFYRKPTIDRRTGRRKLGLDANLPTALMLFGGEGSNVMFSIAERLAKNPSLQLISICGRNAKLKQRLEKLQMRNGHFVDGFTREIPQYMHLADFLIGKPGPGSISEAIEMGLPVIVERNAWTLPQERYNAEWIAERGVGVVLQNFRTIDRAVDELLANGRLDEMRQRAATLENRAVFEIPEILAGIFEKNGNGQ